MVLLAIAIADSARFADPDLWGHLVFGRDIIAAGHAPIVDLHSYPAFGAPWLDHEWLSQVALATAFGVGGVVGLKLLKLALTAGVIVPLAFALGATGAAAPIQLAVLLAVAARLSLQLQFRPQMGTFAMLSVLLALMACENYRARARTPMWIAIPMLALWSNLHGGFIVGVAALLAFGVFSLAANVAGGRGARRGVELCVVTMLASVATLATRYGLGTWRAVAGTVMHPGAVLAISEWRPLIPHLLALTHPMGILFLYDLGAIALFAAFAVSVALTPWLDDLPLDAVGAVMVVAAFAAVRNVPLGLIGCAAPLARHASLPLTRFRARDAAPDSNARNLAAPASKMSLASQLAIAAVAVILAARTGLFSGTLDVMQKYPAGAVAFMRAHDLSGNILAEYTWNDYLLYHLGGESRVFVDSRYETIYPEPVTRDFLEFNSNGPRAAAMLASYPHAFVLVDPTSDAASLMRTRTDWKLIYRDGDSLLYARADSPAAHLPDAPIVATAPPAAFPWRAPRRPTIITAHIDVNQ